MPTGEAAFALLSRPCPAPPMGAPSAAVGPSAEIANETPLVAELKAAVEALQAKQTMFAGRRRTTTDGACSDTLDAAIAALKKSECRNGPMRATSAPLSHSGSARSPSPKSPKKGKGKDGKGKGPKGNKPAVAAAAVSILRRTTPARGPGSVALAAASTSFPVANRRSWLMDTGCRFDLTTSAAIPHNQRNSVYKAPMPIRLSTANDLVLGEQVVDQQIGLLGEVAVPYVLAASPDVLSIGRRCVEDGYSFEWLPYSLHPTITTACGKVVKLVSRDCCPYLDDYEPNYINPSAPAISTEFDKSVTWDPKFESNGPECDTDVPLSDDHNSDDDYQFVVGQSPAATAKDANRDCKVRLTDQPLLEKELDWTVVGKFNPQPIKLRQQGIDNILSALFEVEMAPSARRAVTGDGICIGLNYKTNAFIHPKTKHNCDLIKHIVTEISSHPELCNIPFTSVQINHNTISAPHTDNNLIGTPSIAIGLGDYAGGRLRIDGAKQPLHIRDRALVFDGRKTHSSGTFNGDRWSLVLFVHSSWEFVKPAMRQQLLEFGLPCPPAGATKVALPAVEDAPPPQGGMPPIDVEAPPIDEIVSSTQPKDTIEVALSGAHQMTHTPKNSHCLVCSKAKMQRKQKRRKTSKLVPDEVARPPPTKFGEQVTGDHFIKERQGPDDDEGDPDFPCNTVAVVLYDRGTKWLAVYPKSTKTTYHTIEAMQHFAGPKDKVTSFYSDNAPELVSAARALH